MKNCLHFMTFCVMSDIMQTKRSQKANKSSNLHTHLCPLSVFATAATCLLHIDSCCPASYTSHAATKPTKTDKSK